MTKNEFIEMLKMDMMNALIMRDKTDPCLNEESFGYFNGQYRTYESIINRLLMVRIQETSSGDHRDIRI